MHIGDRPERIDHLGALGLLEEGLVLAFEIAVGGEIAEKRKPESGGLLEILHMARMQRIERPIDHRHLAAMGLKLLELYDHAHFPLDDPSGGYRLLPRPSNGASIAKKSTVSASCNPRSRKEAPSAMCQRRHNHCRGRAVGALKFLGPGQATKLSAKITFLNRPIEKMVSPIRMFLRRRSRRRSSGAAAGTRDWRTIGPAISCGKKVTNSAYSKKVVLARAAAPEAVDLIADLMEVKNGDAERQYEREQTSRPTAPRAAHWKRCARRSRDICSSRAGRD